MAPVLHREPSRGLSAALLAAVGLLAGSTSLGAEAAKPPPTRPPVRRPVRRPPDALRGELPPGPETPPEKLPAQYHGALGQVYLQHRQWAKAEESFQAAYSKEKEPLRRAQYAYSLAQLLMRKKGYDKAAPLLEEAVEHAPATARTYQTRRYRMTLAALYEKTGQAEKAEAVYQGWLKAAPKGYERTMARRELLRLWQRTARLDAAIARYETTLKDTPGDKEALETLRLIYTSIKPNSQKALAVAQKLAEANPDDRDAAMHLLSALELARKYDEAIALIEKLGDKRPVDRDYLTTRLMYLYIRSGQKDKALGLVEGILKKGPESGELHGRAAGFYSQLGKHAEALAQYQAAAKLAKTTADRERYLLSAAYVARRAKNYEQAEALVRPLLQSKSRYTLGQAKRLLFDLYEEQNKLDKLEITPGKP